MDWGFLAVGVGMCFFPATSPLVVIGQCLLLLAAEHFGDATPVALKLLVALNLLELTVRRIRSRDVVLGASAVVLAYLSIGADRLDSDPADVLYKTTLAVGTPLLAGGYLHSTRRLLLESRERAAEAERGRVLAAQMVRTAERTALAREVHDVVAHHVASIVLRVGVARHVVATADDRVREVLDDVHETSARAMDDLRRLVAMLRQPDTGVGADASPMDPDELIPALEALLVNSRQAGLRVDAHIDPAARDVDPLQAIGLLRIVQEGLTNTVKHGGSGASVRLYVRREVWGGTTVDISDDGGHAQGPQREKRQGGKDAPSFVARNATERVGTGHGIIGLRERAALLGGTLHAGPDAAGKGWRMSATLPPPYADGEPSIRFPPVDQGGLTEDVGR